MKKLVAERDLYEKAAANELGARPERLRLEPSMRHLLNGDPRLTIEYWRVRRPNGGEASARHAPDLFAKVALAFQRFYALELKGKWLAARDTTLPLELDSRTDGIGVYEQCEPEAVDVLVFLVRHQHTVAAPAEQPRESSAEPGIAELQELVGKLVDYLRRLGHTEVPVDRLASERATNDLLFTANTLREALDSIGVRYIGASFYVVCPGTHSPVRQAGKIIEFERLSDVPAELICENEIGEPRRHVTEGNIWLKIGHQAPAMTAPRLLLVGAGFAGLLLAITLVFVLLLDAFTDPLLRKVIISGYSVAVLAALATMFKIYGRDAVEWARQVFKK